MHLCFRFVKMVLKDVLSLPLSLVKRRGSKAAAKEQVPVQWYPDIRPSKNRILRQPVIEAWLNIERASYRGGRLSDHALLSNHDFGQIMRQPVIKAARSGNHCFPCFDICLAGYRGTTVLLKNA